MIDIFAFTIKNDKTNALCSRSAHQDLAWLSATEHECCFVSSALLTPRLWRLSCRSQGANTSERGGAGKIRNISSVIRGWTRINALCFMFSCRYYLKSYIFVSQLEALNIPYTVQAFISSPKEGLIKGLWKNHSHEPQVGGIRKRQWCRCLFSVPVSLPGCCGCRLCVW